MLKEICGDGGVILEDIRDDNDNKILIESKISTSDIGISDKSINKTKGSRRFILVGSDEGSHNSARIKITKVIPKNKSWNTHDHVHTISIYRDGKEIVCTGEGIDEFTTKDLEVYKDLYIRNEDLLKSYKSKNITDSELEEQIIKREKVFNGVE